MRTIFEQFPPTDPSGETPEEFSLYTTTQDIINNTFFEVYLDADYWDTYKPYIEKNVSRRNFTPHYMRGILKFGTPFSLEFDSKLTYTENYEQQ
jgi:hypothetical protein